MHDVDASVILERIEDAGYTVSRTRLMEGDTTRYRLTATRVGRKLSGSSSTSGAVYQVEGTNRLEAAQALAKAVSIDLTTS